jgi:hypothetical protein
LITLLPLSKKSLSWRSSFPIIPRMCQIGILSPSLMAPLVSKRIREKFPLPQHRWWPRMA